MKLKKLIIESSLPYQEETKALHITDTTRPTFLLANHPYFKVLQEKNSDFNFLGTSNNNGEILFLNSILADDSLLKRLVTSYTTYQKHTQSLYQSYTPAQLQSFLKLIYSYSLQEKCEALETLKKLYTATLSHTFPKELKKIKKDSQTKDLAVLIDYFSLNLDISIEIVSFLWKIHHTKLSLPTPSSSSPIIVLNNTTYSSSAYYQIVTYYYLLSEKDIFIDSQVDILPLSQLLSITESPIILARYENDNPRHLNYFASIAESLWTSTHLQTQSLLFAFCGHNDANALDTYNLEIVDNLFDKTPYNQFIGMYLTLADNELKLIRYTENETWEFNTFDPVFLGSHLLTKGDSDSSNNEETDKILEVLSELKAKVTSLEKNKNLSDKSDFIKKLNSIEQNLLDLKTEIIEKDSTSSPSQEKTNPYQINQLFEETIANQLNIKDTYHNFDE